MKKYVSSFDLFVSEGFFRDKHKRKPAPIWSDDNTRKMWKWLSKHFGPYSKENWKAWRSDPKFKKWIKKFTEKIGTTPDGAIYQILLGIYGQKNTEERKDRRPQIARNRHWAYQYNVIPFSLLKENLLF